MKNRLLKIIGIIILIGFTMLSQGQVNCVVKAPRQVPVGQAFQAVYELNEKPESVSAVNFVNFKCLGAPTQGSYSSVNINSNGQMQRTQSYSFTYTLVAEKEGNFTLPSIVFVVNNQQVKSEAVSISVTSGTQNQQGNNNRQSTDVQGFNKNDYFIKAFVSNSNPYVGEQTIVNYKLYLGPQTHQYQYQIKTRPTAQGFWVYDLTPKEGNPTRKEEVIDGKKYLVVDMYSMAVYPQKSGKQTISALATDLVVQVIVQQQRSRGNDMFDWFSDPFFGGARAQNIELNLSSNAVSIQAKELPTTNKPSSFSELVGDFKLSAKLSRDKLSANDATNLTVTISGTGNLQYIEPLDFDFPSDIAVHDPEIRDNITTSPSGVSGHRTFEYVLIPRLEGSYTIPSTSFSYFDKRKGTYVTLKTDEFTLNVDKGQSSEQAVSYSNKTDVKVLGNDIRHIKTNWTPKLQTASFLFSSLYWVLFFSPILLLTIFIILVRKRIKMRSNSALLRDKKASKTARKRLRKAEKLLNHNQSEAFYIEISKVLWGYISDKFHIPTGQLSLDTAYQKLYERNMKEESIKEFIDTLNDCEYVRFAPSPDITPEKMYERTFNFITKIEQGLKR